MRLWPRRRGSTRAAPQPSGPQLRLERDRYAPGERIRGVVALDRGAADLEVSLNFHERSTEYEATPISLLAEPLGAEGPAADGHRFAIELPEDAPPSLEAKHGALWWTVDARVGGPESPALVSRRVEVGSPASTAPGSAGGAGPEAGPPRPS